MLLYVTQLHTGDNMGSRSISFAILAVTVLALYAVPVGGLSADGAITVEDGLGETFSFDGPVDSVVSIGVGVTATVIGIGALDKVVVCDLYFSQHFQNNQVLLSFHQILSGSFHPSE